MISHFSPDLVAAKELEELERWKKQQREKSINLPPMTLGKPASQLLECRRTGPPYDPLSTLPTSVFRCLL